MCPVFAGKIERHTHVRRYQKEPFFILPLGLVRYITVRTYASTIPFIISNPESTNKIAYNLVQIQSFSITHTLNMPEDTLGKRKKLIAVFSQKS